MGPPEKRARTEDVESHATNPLNITFTARPKKISSQQIVPKEPHVSPDNNFSWLSSENASIKKIISQLSQSDRDVTLNALKKINTACIQNEKNMLDFLRRGGIEALEECFQRFSCSPSHCAQVARIICTSVGTSQEQARCWSKMKKWSSTNREVLYKDLFLNHCMQILSVIQDKKCTKSVLKLLECFWPDFCLPQTSSSFFVGQLNRSYRHTLKFILSPSKAKGSVIAAANPMSASLKKCGLIVASLLKHIVGTLQEEVSESNLSPGQKKICCIIAIILSYGHQDVVAALMKPVWEILKDLTSFVKIVGVDGVLEIAFHVFRRFRLDQEGTPREAFSEVIKSMLDFLQRLIVDWLDAERWKTLSTKRVVLLFTLALSMPKYLVTAEKLSVLDMILGWMKCFTRQFFKLLREVKKEDVEIRFDMALQAMFCFLADLSDNHWELHDVYVETLDNLGSWIVDESVSLLVQYFFLLIFTMKAEKEETTARKLANIPVFPHLVSIIVKHIFSSQTPDISQLERQYGKRIFPWKVLFRIYVDHRPIALLNSKALDCFDLDISLGSGDMERWAVEMRREMCHAVLNRCTEPEVFKVLLIHHIFLRVPMQYFDKRFPHVLHDRYFQEFGLHLAQDDPLILADLMVLVSMAKSCDDCRAFLYREQLVLKTVQLLTKKGEVVRPHYVARGLVFAVRGTKDVWKNELIQATPTRECEYLGLKLKRSSSCVQFVCGSEETGVCILGDKQTMSSRLPYFNAMFEREFLESVSSVVSFPWLEPQLAVFLFHSLHSCRLSDHRRMCPVLEQLFDERSSLVPELFEIADFLGFEELAVDLETHIRNMSTKRPEKLLTVFHATQGTDMEEVTMVSMCRTSLSSTEKPHTSTCYRATQVICDAIEKDSVIINSLVKSIGVLIYDY